MLETLLMDGGMTLLSSSIQRTFEMNTSENILDPSNWAGAYDRVALIAPIVFWIVSTMCSLTGLFGIAQTTFGFAVHVIVGMGENFWSEVDEAHKQKLTLRRNSGGNQVVETFTSAKYLIMSFIPNLKALTLYNETIDMKRFWIEFIPKTLLTLMLSLFVYFGNTFILVNETKDLTLAVSRMIEDNIDLGGLVERIPGSIHIKQFSRSGSDEPVDVLTIEIAQKLTTRLYALYPDITRESKVSIDSDVEEWVAGELQAITNEGGSITDLADTVKYQRTTNIIVGRGAPAGEANRQAKAQQGRLFTHVRHTQPGAWNLGIPESTIDPTQYIGFTVAFMERPIDASARRDINLSWGSRITSDNNGTTFSFDIPPGFTAQASSGARVSWGNGSFSGTAVVDGNRVVVTRSGSAGRPGDNEMLTIDGGLSIVHENNLGQRGVIRRINGDGVTRGKLFNGTADVTNDDFTGAPTQQARP